MLEVLHKLVHDDALVQLGDSAVKLVSWLAQSAMDMFDLPRTDSLESFRVAKVSGLENSSVPVAVGLGLRIGAASRLSAGSAYASSSSTLSGEASSSRKSTVSMAPKSPNGFHHVIPRCMSLLIVMDILSVILIKQSFGHACASRLGIANWGIVGLVLGFPCTVLVDSVRREYSHRAAFSVEMLLLFASFLWLCYGGSLLFNGASVCIDSIAGLWWLSYSSTILSLSIAGTAIFSIVITTVLSLLYGGSK